jgi:outer membrane protein TolC
MYSPFKPRALTILLTTVLATGCAITPEPLTAESYQLITAQDQQAIEADMVPLTAPLTLPEAIARALKFNLEHRSKLWEQALAVGQFEAGRFDMLPKVMANIGYHDRSNPADTWSPDASGNPSNRLSPVGAEKRHATSDLGLTWSILDFGLSYHGAKQNADRVLIASERRRKAMHTLIQNVRTTYWRAAGAERLAKEVRETIALAETAMSDSRKIEADRVKAPGDALRYQRAVLENLRTLESVERELAAARIELASLINIPPGVPFTLAEPTGPLAQPGPLVLPVEQMEALALAHNADLKEHAYNARIAAVETRKAMLRLFPNLSLNFAGKHDSNSFLVNQSWSESAVQVSWNLLNLLSGPAQTAAAEIAVKVAEARRLATHMAVLMQVHLAARQYDTALRLFDRAHAIWDVDQRLLTLAEAGEQSQTQSQQAMVAARTTTILSLLRRYQAVAGVHEAASKLHATLGLEPDIDSLDDISLADLAVLIEKSLTRAIGQTVPVPTIPAAAPVAASEPVLSQLSRQEIDGRVSQH